MTIRTIIKDGKPYWQIADILDPVDLIPSSYGCYPAIELPKTKGAIAVNHEMVEYEPEVDLFSRLIENIRKNRNASLH